MRPATTTLPPMALPAEAWKLENISPKAYQHPADRATTAALAGVPYLDQVVRKLVALGYERSLRTATLGAACGWATTSCRTSTSSSARSTTCSTTSPCPTCT